VEAFFAAKRRKDFALKGYNRWFVYLVIIIILLMAGVFYNLGNIPKDFASGVLGYKFYGIKTGSMEPTLLTGDKLITDTKYFKNNTPQRGDLVIIRVPGNPSMDFIKRVIALPGEKIEIKNQQVYINDAALPESEVVRDNSNMDAAARGDFGPVLVPPECCFVLGDNRDNSTDSRIWGSLPLRNIKGKPLYVYWAKDKSRIGKMLR
jgi:signal peptidase I